MIEVYLYVFWDEKLIGTYVKIRQNNQEPLFWPHFGLKLPKISTFWPKNKISDFNLIGVYLYVFWDLKFIGIC